MAAIMQEDENTEDVEVTNEEDTENKIPWSKEDTEKAYNIARTIVEFINPEQSRTAQLLVQSCQELVASIEQMGNIEESSPEAQDVSTV